MNIKFLFHLTDIHTSCHFDKLSDLKMARSVLVFFHYIIVVIMTLNMVYSILKSLSLKDTSG